MTKTTNYQLNQWDATDRVLRTDFNSDNQKIEEALSALADCMITGSYTGDGVVGREIDLGFKPRILMLSGTWGVNSNHYPIFTLLFGPYAHTFRHDTAGVGSTHVQLTDSGFQLLSGGYHNISGRTYNYMAIR